MSFRTSSKLQGTNLLLLFYSFKHHTFTRAPTIRQTTQRMHFRLFALPSELVVCVIEQVDDCETLGALCLTSKTLLRLTEPLFYRHIFLRTGFKAETFFHSLRLEPSRQTAVRSLEARCMYGQEDGFDCLNQILGLCPNIRDLIIESPYLYKSRWIETTGPGWPNLLNAWMMPLFRATCLSGPALSPPPLQKLTKLTLHLTGTGGQEYWHAAGTYASIFAHPTLQELRISSASLADDALDLVPADLKTPLKSLKFDQCNISHKSLTRVLAIPQALEKLSIAEVIGGEEPTPTSQSYNILADGDPPAFEFALSQQHASLKSLYYASSIGINPDSLRDEFPTGRSSINLSKFSQLEKISIESPCFRLEQALLSPKSGPPCLKELRIRATYSIKVIEPMIPSNNTVVTQPREWANYILSVAKAFPSLSKVEVVLDYSERMEFVPLPADEIRSIADTNMVLNARGCIFSVSSLRHYGNYNPSLFYGEYEPDFAPIFDSAKGFQWGVDMPRTYSRDFRTSYQSDSDYSDDECNERARDAAESSVVGIRDFKPGIQHDYMIVTECYFDSCRTLLLIASR
nr:hypothetical protein CFP56_66883 [Quercus suber]